MGDKEKPEIIMCCDCGKEPAMIRKDTGKVVNGRCGICQNKIRNAIRKNKGSEIIKKKMKERSKTVKLVLEIDKEFYPDLIEKLDDAAREDIRGREHEALYIIVKHLKERFGHDNRS